ncbi:PP2C family protein-serine/threonine phosphatase [Alloacidobacterium sp.]|uniref:PP2C family protein-serine/threonine phosphatase n=1 Tax=Alloacidobacterium sp. TaxID=2951999 RepID=UPI002D59EF03|nr:SpoIIE family protein phosphatase [Alloacidobacterium sp.]HYK36265.1 SpoIIE family protein phosphatase [Alloacidobacterium sp.]
MSRPAAPVWEVRPSIRLDRQDPFLLLQQVLVFVRDHDRSIHFFVENLGFNIALDHKNQNGERWVIVAPPDGTARLCLIVPKLESQDYPLIGKGRNTVFLTENIEAKYQEWSARGVHFLHPPETAPWGSVFTQFDDVDGNRFWLIGFDQATRDVEEQRRLTEERLEAERRAARELEIARQVQARLFPQNMPSAQSLDYAGACIQARQVGGDYYDWLNLGADRLGLVLADIAGKGMAAALLMANLQANLRSQWATASDEPQRFLQSVNKLFYENTASGDYATLFFAEYNDQTRRLRYANCGHLPALLLRRDNTLEHLGPTSTVLGLFAEWDCCSFEERQLFPGDTLLLYTDGATESSNESGEEFGEQHLAETLRRFRDLSSQDLISAIVKEVRQFDPGEQQDDITLIAARCR